MQGNLLVIRKIALFAEVFLAVFFGVAALGLPYEKVAGFIPYFTEISAGVALGAILLAVAGCIRTSSASLSGAWAAMLSFTAFMACGPESAAGGLPPLWLLVTFVSALLGKRGYWIGTALIFILGEPVRNLLTTLLAGEQPDPASLITPSLLDIWRYLYLLVAGIVGSRVLQSFRVSHYAVKPAVLPDDLSEKKHEASDAEDKEPPAAERTTSIEINTGEQGISDLLSSVVYFMSRNFRAYSSVGFIFDTMRREFILNSFQSKSLYIKKEASIPLGTGVIGKLGTEMRPFMTGDLRHYNAELSYYREEEQINSILAVPIVSDKVLLGALVLDSRDTQAFKDQDKDIMRRFATLAAALIKTERMRFEQEKSARVSQLFYQASHQFTTALKADEVFNVLFSVIPGVVPCTRQISIEFDGDSNTGKVTGASGAAQPDDPDAGFVFPVDSGGLYAFTFQKRKSLIIGDYQQYKDRYFRFFPQEKRSESIRSLAVYPIIDDEQRCRGLYSLESDQPDIFTEDTQQILTTLVENASVAFVRAMLYHKMELLATTDGLTGLNNHRTFQELLGQEIERSRRYNRPIALLLMDIDHFKTFNDTYGHPVGDLVLKEIAACIRRSIRLNDIPARYGGEEFVVIIPETNERGSMVTAERIRSTIEQHTIVSLDKELKVTVSIGCSAFPENAPSQQALIDTADKALYMAKKSGRNRVIPYKNGM